VYESKIKVSCRKRKLILKIEVEFRVWLNFQMLSLIFSKTNLVFKMKMKSTHN